MARKQGRLFEFSQYPGYKKLYINAFERMLEVRKARGKTMNDMRWGKTAEDVFHWWIEDGVLPGQTSMWGNS